MSLTLYFAGGSCSLPALVGLEEAGAQFEAVRLDNRSLSLVPRLIPSVLLEASLDKGVSTTTGDALDTVYPVSCVDETEASNFCEFKAVKAT